jgi:TRAP-type C4-dicarboxylate transport system permease small subunit
MANFISAIFFFIIVYTTSRFMPRLMTQTSPAMGIPIAYVYLIMIIGSLFIGLWYLFLAITALAKHGSEKQPLDKSVSKDPEDNKKEGADS